jgi:hypothetical protein
MTFTEALSRSSSCRPFDQSAGICMGYYKRRAKRQEVAIFLVSR